MYRVGTQHYKAKDQKLKDIFMQQHLSMFSNLTLRLLCVWVCVLCYFYWKEKLIAENQFFWLTNIFYVCKNGWWLWLNVMILDDDL